MPLLAATRLQCRRGRTGWWETDRMEMAVLVVLGLAHLIILVVPVVPELT